MSTLEMNENDWKLSALVHLPILDLKNTHYQTPGHILRISKSKYLKRANLFLAEVYSPYSLESNEEKVISKSIEALSTALAVFSLRILGKCYIEQILGLSPYQVKPGQEFKILIPIDYNIRTLDVELVHDTFFENYNEEKKELFNSLREFNQAINSDSIIRRFHHFYNSVERIAEYLTTKVSKSTCDNCGHTIRTFKDINDSFRKLFMKYEINEKQFKVCRRIRARIAHGAAKEELELLEKVHSNISYLEKISASELSLLLNIETPNSIARIYDQYWNITAICKKTIRTIYKPAFYIIEKSLQFRTGVVEIQKKENYDWSPLTSEIHGHKSKLPINPFSWPYIKSP